MTEPAEKPKSKADWIAEKVREAIPEIARAVEERARRTNTPIITYDHETKQIVYTYPEPPDSKR